MTIIIAIIVTILVLFMLVLIYSLCAIQKNQDYIEYVKGENENEKDLL